jgi:hypothetical protein
VDDGSGDPAVAEMLTLVRRRSHDALHSPAQRLEDLGALAPSDRDRTVDVFWYLFGWMSWRTLIIDLGST